MNDELVKQLRYVAKVFRDYDEFAPEDIRLAGTVPDKAAARIEADACRIDAAVDLLAERNQRIAELEGLVKEAREVLGLVTGGPNGRPPLTYGNEWHLAMERARALLARMGGSDGSA
jgi:hypothetical protein